MVETQHNAWDKVAGKMAFTLEPDLVTLATLISQDPKILDYGCGYGRITHALHTLGYRHLIGVDTSAEMIRRGLRLYPALDLRHMDSHEIPTAWRQFDVILLCAVLTCIPTPVNRAQVLASVYQSLKAGGILYCAEFCQTETTQYSASGTFKTAFNVEMKHFLPQELREELYLFHEISHAVTETTTLSGAKISAIHYFGKKC